jgi:ethanolamine permease
MAAYVILKLKHPEANRPHLSPFGIPGAIIAGVLALAIFIGVLLNPAYTIAIYSVVGLYVLALIAFAVYGRHQLVLSPEEEYALSGGLK